ncbi:hypothetical protein HAX54_044106 [Datura stramonium]|uniref:Putative plant transposon protein domain-containing protein n=1 Tax=Datura stramonium TaxID=4076 RepID=A0ABS8W3K1_DATST|nr:hypothetical protein [Datura stramonium]
MVREFYANYMATLDGMYKKGQKVTDMPILLSVQVRGIQVDNSANTINRMLYGPEFMLPSRTIEFDYRMREQHNQHSWLTQVLTDGDNALEEDREVLVASLMLAFPLNIGVVIADEIKSQATTLSTSLPFPCLITRLCREAHVPILAGIDIETPTIKKYNLEKSKDETRHDLKLHKSVFEVFGLSDQSARVAKGIIHIAGAATGTELVCLAASLPTSTPSTSGAAVET